MGAQSVLCVYRSPSLLAPLSLDHFFRVQTGPQHLPGWSLASGIFLKSGNGERWEKPGLLRMCLWRADGMWDGSTGWEHGLWSHVPGLKSQFYHLLVLQSHASSLTPLCFSFLISKMGMMMISLHRMVMWIQWVKVCKMFRTLSSCSIYCHCNNSHCGRFRGCLCHQHLHPSLCKAIIKVAGLLTYKKIDEMGYLRSRCWIIS